MLQPYAGAVTGSGNPTNSWEAIQKLLGAQVNQPTSPDTVATNTTVGPIDPNSPLNILDGTSGTTPGISVNDGNVTIPGITDQPTGNPFDFSFGNGKAPDLAPTAVYD